MQNDSLEPIYRATLERWGEQAQFDQAIEECAELITGLMHYRRDRVNEEDVVRELADVTLMVGQLTWMLGPEKVERAVAEKLDKLKTLLADEKAL